MELFRNDAAARLIELPRASPLLAGDGESACLIPVFATRSGNGRMVQSQTLHEESR
jgi:hypothetical protein